jgi:hypothetical protein
MGPSSLARPAPCVSSPGSRRIVMSAPLHRAALSGAAGWASKSLPRKRAAGPAMVACDSSASCWGSSRAPPTNELHPVGPRRHDPHLVVRPPSRARRRGRKRQARQSCSLTSVTNTAVAAGPRPLSAPQLGLAVRTRPSSTEGLAREQVRDCRVFFGHVSNSVSPRRPSSWLAVPLRSAGLVRRASRCRSPTFLSRPWAGPIVR